MSPNPSLTPREQEVLALLTAGKTTRQICRTLLVSEGTVKSHLTSIYRKLDVTNRTEAAIAGMRMRSERMGLPGGQRIWKPQEWQTLHGAFQHVGGTNCAVRTEDGVVWLLEADAENQLAALGPDEGQLVRVSYRQESWPRSNYQVSLIAAEDAREEGSA